MPSGVLHQVTNTGLHILRISSWRTQLYNRKEIDGLLIKIMITAYVLPVLLTIGVLILTVFIYSASKKHMVNSTIEPNYLAFFILGICLFPVGIILWYVTHNLAFLGIALLGFINLIVSLAHTDTWRT